MVQRIKKAGQQINRWLAALHAGDADAVTRLYAADAILLATLKGDVKRGHPRIRDYFATDFLPKHPAGSVVELHTRLLGEVAVNSGVYAFDMDTQAGGRETIEARYTFVYQRTGKDWLIVEHHSSLRPDQSPAQATRSRRSGMPAEPAAQIHTPEPPYPPV